MADTLPTVIIYKPENIIGINRTLTDFAKLNIALKTIENPEKISQISIYTKTINISPTEFPEKKFSYVKEENFREIIKDPVNTYFYYFENDKISEEEIRSYYEKSPEQYVIRSFNIKGEELIPYWVQDKSDKDDDKIKCDDLYLFCSKDELHNIENMTVIKKPIFLIGERGTGKTTIVEKYIKQCLGTPDKNFVSIACGTLEPALAKSELFGYEKGAFTGAIKRTEGKIKKANNGCLFLDEVQDLSKEVQRMLIKGIEDHKFYRVGSTEPYESNFFLVCSSNRPMSELRQALYDDFYDRICFLPQKVKSLEEQKTEDGNFISKCLPIIWLNYKLKCSSPYQFPGYHRLEEFDIPSQKDPIKKRLIDVLMNNNLKGNYRDINKLLGYLELYVFNAKLFNPPPSNETINKNINFAIEKWQEYITERNLTEEINNAPETFSDDFIKNQTWKSLNKMFKSWVAEQGVRIYGSVNAAAEKLAVDKNVIRNNLQDKKTTDLES
jgi:transcriptional regulator with AAA-type ATPase domain